MPKRQLYDLLKSPDFAQRVGAGRDFPRRGLVKQLLAALCSEDEEIKWHAVTAMGIVVADLAREDLEGARDVLRRLIWSLNEESGGTGWGMPEAMGEILARREGLAREYAPILLSYLQPDGNLLEFAPLQQGALWAVGRLAERFPGILRALGARPTLSPFLASPEPRTRGLAVWALGGIGEGLSDLEPLLGDEAEILLYRDQGFFRASVGLLAREALAARRNPEPGSSS